MFSFCHLINIWNPRNHWEHLHHCQALVEFQKNFKNVTFINPKNQFKRLLTVFFLCRDEGQERHKLKLMNFAEKHLHILGILLGHPLDLNTHAVRAEEVFITFGEKQPYISFYPLWCYKGEVTAEGKSCSGLTGGGKGAVISRHYLLRIYLKGCGFVECALEMLNDASVNCWYIIHEVPPNHPWNNWCYKHHWSKPDFLQKSVFSPLLFMLMYAGVLTMKGMGKWCSLGAGW